MIYKGKHDPDSSADWHQDPERFVAFVQDSFQRAVRRAIAHHHLDGRSVSLWQDGRIVEQHPDGTITPLHHNDNR